MITIIAAVGTNHELGKDNKMLWHLPKDFKMFKEQTSGHPIIMGRKTFESLPGILPNRQHLVISRQEDYKAEGAMVFKTLADAISFTKNEEQTFIIGGGEIYTLGMEFADKLVITEVDGEFESDAFFPTIDKNKWKVVKTEFHDKDEKHKYNFTFKEYLIR